MFFPLFLMSLITIGIGVKILMSLETFTGDMKVVAAQLNEMAIGLEDTDAKVEAMFDIIKAGGFTPEIEATLTAGLQEIKDAQAKVAAAAAKIPVDDEAAPPPPPVEE